MRTEFNYKTMITIAHRRSTIMQSEKVMVLSKGQITEFDEPATLAANTNSQFSSLLKYIDDKERNQVISID